MMHSFALADTVSAFPFYLVRYVSRGVQDLLHTLQIYVPMVIIGICLPVKAL